MGSLGHFCGLRQLRLNQKPVQAHLGSPSLCQNRKGLYRFRCKIRRNRYLIFRQNVFALVLYLGLVGHPKVVGLVFLLFLQVFLKKLEHAQHLPYRCPYVEEHCQQLFWLCLSLPYLGSKLGISGSNLGRHCAFCLFQRVF